MGFATPHVDEAMAADLAEAVVDAVFEAFGAMTGCDAERANDLPTFQRALDLAADRLVGDARLT